jgi:LCP family protein required for cell wall assembly
MKLKDFFKGFRKGKRAEKKPNRFIAWWKSRRLSIKIAMIAGVSLLILLLTALLVMRLWIRPPEEKPILTNEPTAPGIELPPGVSPGFDGETPLAAREGIFTFLLVGIHEGNTDTLMVATLDIGRGTCHVMSIPRDTLVVRAPRNLRKINAAYSQRRDTWDDEPGMPQLKKEIATLIGFRPQYSAMVDYRGFVRLIDAIDGVDFDVPMRMYVPSEGINLQKGPQHLTGNQAMQLVRFRYNHATGWGYDDYGRMETQQKLLKEAGKKALSSLTRAGEYIEIAKENVQSEDLDWGNMLWFVEQINKIGMDNVVFNTLPTYTLDRNYYEAIYAEEALALINETINPFEKPIGRELVEWDYN